MSRLRLVLPGLLLVACAWAQAPNLLTNPGFEGSGATMNGWYCPEYWSGTAAVVTGPDQVHGGKSAWQITAAPKNNEVWGRLHAIPQPITVGLRYRLSVWARGTGQIKLGVIQYQRKYPEGIEYHYAWGDLVPLTDQWQEFSFEFATVHDDVQTAAATFEVRGDKAVMTVDDAVLRVANAGTGTLAVEPPYQMVAVGQPATVNVTGQRDGQPLAGQTVLVLQRTATGLVRRELTLDAQGHGQCAVAAASEPSVGEALRLQVVSPANGLTGSACVDTVTTDTLKEFETLAQRARLKTPCHLLFLGDSLTDFYRGYNYVDQLTYWLRKAKGDGVTTKNAGVGGDYITRVWQRLQGDPKVWRLEMYKDLFVPKPDRIFIFLGHNDSKETSGSNFTESNVKPEEFDTTFRTVIAYLKAQTGATITLLSASSSVYEITKANADKAVAAGKGASLFGRPETLEKYNALMQKIAADTGCGYIDVYAPTKTYPDKPSLFMPDGVHVNLAGNHLLAREVLRWLAQ